MLKKIYQIFKWIILPFSLVSFLIILILSFLGSEINTEIRYATQTILSNVNNQSSSFEESRRQLRVAIKTAKTNLSKKKLVNNSK